MTPKRVAIFLGLALMLVVLAACASSVPSMDSIRDSKLFDKRIKETPRQTVMRECQQEASRFHVSCTHCHSTDKAEGITAEAPVLTKIGERAQIMRMSPTFGLHQDCHNCHQTKFALNRNAERLFGPGGAKYGESLQALRVDK